MVVNSAKQFFDLSTINRMMYDVTKKKKKQERTNLFENNLV